jgi:hypothetical protein
MIEQLEDQQVEMPADVPLPSDADVESKIDGEITSLWTAHQAGKATVLRTKSELADLRRSLGERLWSMKCILACSGRAGKWAAYLRSHQLPRATADRYVSLHQASMADPTKRLSEAIPEPTVEDVKKLVQRLLPRLRPILKTEELIGEFLYEVVQQLAHGNQQPD